MTDPPVPDRECCPACGGGFRDPELTLREMMFGTRERFAYRVCDDCGSAWIARVPSDLGLHYPDAYYSFHAPEGVSGVKDFFKSRRSAHALGQLNPIGWLALRIWGGTDYLEWCARMGIRQTARVLDVGCGSGHLLRRMHAGGFRRLTGIDPFLDGDLNPAPGLEILRRGVAEIDGPFDLVMLHHSLEHVPDPAATLRHVRRLLGPGGRALVRLPILGGEAPRTYGADWVQWDAPRHLFIPTRTGMERLATSASLSVDEVIYDSTALQFWGSELYRRDVPLAAAEGRLEGGADPLFTPEQMRAYDSLARELNAAEEGDQACFFLRAV
jgi:SAM-dependent methyltransferase